MALPEMKYPGRCELCGQVVGKPQMTRHMARCLAKKTENGGVIAKLLHLVVEGTHLPMYWLHVEVPGAMMLVELDTFLRRIWLECCDHLSCFTVSGQRYSVHPAESLFDGPRERSMAIKIYSVLQSGTRFTHEYDYGSTTDLSLKVVGTREGALGKRPGVVLLARNDPPAWNCSACGKPATQVRAAGWDLDLDRMFCDDCIEEDQEEYYLPVVNSPRTGVCGYAG